MEYPACRGCEKQSREYELEFLDGTVIEYIDGGREIEIQVLCTGCSKYHKILYGFETIKYDWITNSLMGK